MSVVFPFGAIAAQCPKPEIVRQAVLTQLGATTAPNKNAIDDDPIGGGVAAGRDAKQSIDDDLIGGGVTSDSEWKVSADVLGAFDIFSDGTIFDIFGDGSTYLQAISASIYKGQLSCAYGFSEASGLGFQKAATITLKDQKCRTQKRRDWRIKRSVFTCDLQENVCLFSCR
jgi:hypothetical protein